jgi:hypothetical protein
VDVIIHANRSLFTAEKKTIEREEIVLCPATLFHSPAPTCWAAVTLAPGPDSSLAIHSIEHFLTFQAIPECCRRIDKYNCVMSREVSGASSITHAPLKGDLSPSATALPAHCCIMDGGMFTQLDWLNILFLLL